MTHPGRSKNQNSPTLYATEEKNL